jgi:hypothetical protein
MARVLQPFRGQKRMIRPLSLPVIWGVFIARPFLVATGGDSVKHESRIRWRLPCLFISENVKYCHLTALGGVANTNKKVLI